VTAKCSLFVDAGYLLAASASKLTGTSLRSGIHVKYRRLIRGLIKAAEETTGLPVLRVHWYDSAKDGVPDRSQERIGELPKVKLRLGRFGYDGQQKGVDLRLGLDMVAHAHHKAAEVFLLVSGDDDLSEAVEEVQVHGVSVMILAVPGADGQPHGVSRHLVRSADEIVTLDPLIIDEAIIPIETPEQAKDDSVDLLHNNPDVLLMKPNLGTSDLALLADAMVFGATIPSDDTEAVILVEPHIELPPHHIEVPAGLHDAEHGFPGETSHHETAHPETVEATHPIADGFGLEQELLDLSDVEILLNAAHLDLPNQGDQYPALPESTIAPELHSDSVLHIDSELTGESELPGEAKSYGESESHNNISDQAVGNDQAAKPEIVIPKPGPRGIGEALEKQNTTALPQESKGEATNPAPSFGVVTDTLNRMLQGATPGLQTEVPRPSALRPTPRDVSSNIGRPALADRPFRPTYSTGPDQPKQGTWAHQWSEVIDSVVGRVLNSLTKSTTVETWNIIGLGRPSIPQEIDKALLLDATEAMGVYTLSDAERHEVRAAFWREFDHVQR